MAGGGKWPLSFAQLKGGFPLEWGEQRIALLTKLITI